MDSAQLYRELQVKAALIAEKERALPARRAALAELKQQVETAQSECNHRQAPLAAEMQRLNAAKAECLEAKAQRENAARSQQQRLTELKEEQHALQHAIQQRLDAIDAANERVRRAREDAANADGIDAAIDAMKQRADAEAESLHAFEARVRDLHGASTSRRASAGLPQLDLPVDDARAALPAPSQASAPHTREPSRVQPPTDPAPAAPAELPAGNTVVFFDESDDDCRA